jgi:hypothetical protein
MNRIRKPFLLVLAISTLFAGLAAAQTRTFDETGIEYTFEIPDERWKMVSRTPHTNLVFGTAREGDMEVRKITAPSTKPLIDVITEEEDKLRFLQGFVAGKQENFSGALRGSIYNYEFLKSGRPMAGRFYYLRSGDTIYVLRFTAYTNNLRSLRVQTDVIARTFQLKKA